MYKVVLNFNLIFTFRLAISLVFFKEAVNLSTNNNFSYYRCMIFLLASEMQSSLPILPLPTYTYFESRNEVSLRYTPPPALPTTTKTSGTKLLSPTHGGESPRRERYPM